MSLTVAVIQPPSAIFREDQRFGWWLYALLATLMALAWAMFEGKVPVGRQVALLHGRLFLLGVVAGMVLPVVITVGALRMTTLVTPTDVRVWFGFLPTYRRSIGIEAITRVEVVQYRPLRDYGGWGLLHGRDNERVLNARGNRGVRLHLVDGSKMLIGSQRPEELALAVEGSLRPGR